MPFIISAIVWLLGDSTRKVAWGVALYALYFTASISVVVAFVASIKAIISSIYVGVPQIALDVWLWVVPDNAIPVLAAVYSAKILRSLYDIRQRLLLVHTKVHKT